MKWKYDDPEASGFHLTLISILFGVFIAAALVSGIQTRCLVVGIGLELSVWCSQTVSVTAMHDEAAVQVYIPALITGYSLFSNSVESSFGRSFLYQLD